MENEKKNDGTGEESFRIVKSVRIEVEDLGG